MKQDLLVNEYSFRLGVVVPLANEEKTIDFFLDEVLHQLSDNDIVFCVVDNVSQDSTRQILKARSQKDKRIYEVWAPENRCVVDAYFSGYKKAISKRCKWILEIDGGFSHNPKDIPMFINAMEQGYDFAAGCRFLKESNYKGISYRKFVSKFGTILSNILLKTKFNDMTSGFECFTYDAMKYILEKGVSSRAHFFQTEIRYLLSSWKYIEIPISYQTPSNRLGNQNIVEAFSILFQLYSETNKPKE